MTEDESLLRYGLRPSGHDLDQVRDMPQAQAALERHGQGEAADDFAGFSVENQARWYSQDYGF